MLTKLLMGLVFAAIIVTAAAGEQKFNCSENMVSVCEDGCIPTEWLCDGADDCKNGDDERNCNNETAVNEEKPQNAEAQQLPAVIETTTKFDVEIKCQKGEFACFGLCILEENGCPGGAMPLSCFPLDNKTILICIVANGVKESKESTPIKVPSKTFRRSYQPSSYQNPNWNVRYHDRGQNKYPAPSLGYGSRVTTYQVSKVPCQYSERSCNGFCIPSEFIDKCPNAGSSKPRIHCRGIDVQKIEIECRNIHPTRPIVPTCPSGITCYDGTCVSKEQICDNKRDCPTGEDEWNCSQPSGKQTYADSVIKEKVCPLGMTEIDDDTCVLIEKKMVSWNNANAECEGMHGLSLLEIPSMETLNLVRSLLQRPDYRKIDFWIGGYKYDDGILRWIKTGHPVMTNPEAWNPFLLKDTLRNEPNSDCLMLGSCFGSHSLDDFECSRLKGFICMSPLITTYRPQKYYPVSEPMPYVHTSRGQYNNPVSYGRPGYALEAPKTGYVPQVASQYKTAQDHRGDYFKQLYRQPISTFVNPKETPYIYQQKTFDSSSF